MGKKHTAPELIDPDNLHPDLADDHSHLHLSTSSSRRVKTSIETITAPVSIDIRALLNNLPITWDCLPSISAPAIIWNDDPDACGEDVLTQKITSGFIETVDELPCEDTTENQKGYALEHPMLQWTPFIEEFVSEMLRLEGLNKTQCSGCQLPSVSLLRCKDCKGDSVFCQGCIVALHSYNPFHIVEQWNGVFFEKKTLKSLGLRVQFGHPPGESCAIPDGRSSDRFIVIDINGIHSVAVDFCACSLTQPRHVQLLHSRLYPATVTDPLTAATFQVLHYFQLLSFMSKIPAFDFYHNLARLSDNTGLLKIRDRYSAFLRMVREWRHIKLLKRLGRGHSALGISSVSGNPQGGCALICPACPQPGVNVPSDRETLKHWKYTLFVGLDANFCLKRLNVSNSQRDPCLNRGLAYVVDPAAFSSHLTMFNNAPDDDSTGDCNNHDAIKSASIRGSRGTAASGAGTVECIRHDFKCPNAVGDLQKGERYVNMDYFFLSTVRHNPTPNILVSYDIACQWHRKILDRCATYAPELTEGFLTCSPRYAVNKMHINAHRQDCQVNFSLNLMPYVGRTDGEAPERGWAAINAIANSTKEMGPGSRNDTLDDHFRDYNWRKIVAMGVMFIRKVKDSIQHQSEQLEAFNEFTASLNPTSINMWLEGVTQWEQDPSKPNPFYSADKKISKHEVRLKLAEEEEQALRDGLADQVHKHISGSMMLFQGLELEAQQYRLKCDISKLGKHSTELQRSKIVERKNAMKRKIDAWIDIQHLYMPALTIIRGDEDREGSSKSTDVTEIMLLLPSNVTQRLRVNKRLQTYEARLRHAQCHDLLESIRRHFYLRTRLLKSKDRFSHGQAMHTRSHTLLDTVNERIIFDSERYHRCYSALIILSASLNDDSWKLGLQELLDEDVRSLDSAQSQGVTEGRRLISWIWQTGRTFENGEQEMEENLRIEWCKARARAHRWSEECILLREEMHRVLATLEWQANWWMSQTVTSTSGSTVNLIDIGRHAYAVHQARIRSDMRERFAQSWEAAFISLDKLDLSIIPV